MPACPTGSFVTIVPWRLGEGAHLVGIARFDDHPVAVQVLAEDPVELDLVLEDVAEVRVVELLRELVRDGVGHVRRPLVAAQDREVVVDVVLEADVAESRLPEHVDDDRGRPLVVLGRRLLRTLEDRSDVDPSCTADEVAKAGREAEAF